MRLFHNQDRSVDGAKDRVAYTAQSTPQCAETAAAHGLTGQWPSQMDIDERIETWRTLSVTLNELNRSMGRSDAYPFVLNTAVELKLTFVDRVIRQLQTQR